MDASLVPVYPGLVASDYGVHEIWSLFMQLCAVSLVPQFGRETVSLSDYLSFVWDVYVPELMTHTGDEFPFLSLVSQLVIIGHVFRIVMPSVYFKNPRGVLSTSESPPSPALNIIKGRSYSWGFFNAYTFAEVLFFAKFLNNPTSR